MKKILITGGAGYIGSKIVTDFINKNYKVYVIDNLSTGFKYLINKKAKFYKCDIANQIKIKKIITKFKIDSVIHCAASTNVKESEMKPKKYLLNNVNKTELFLNSLRDTSVKNIIYSSTCAVYGKIKIKVNERSKLKPDNYYGKTKVLAEKLVVKFSKKYNLNYALLRFFNVGGSDLKNKIGCVKNNNQLLKNFSEEIKRKTYKIKIFGNNYNTPDGTCVRDFIHINDLSRIHFLILKKISKNNKSYILNCGYGKGYSILNIINIFEKIIKKKLNVNNLPRRKGDIPYMVADNSKLKNILKFKQKYNIKDIISSSLSWELNINS